MLLYKIIYSKTNNLLRSFLIVGCSSVKLEHSIIQVRLLNETLYNHNDFSSRALNVARS